MLAVSDMANQSKQVEIARKSSRSLKVKGGRLRKNRVLRPRVKVDGSLRVRSNQKPNESLSNQDTVIASNKKSRNRRNRRKRKKVIEEDEYCTIRKRLRYMLNRMSYEKSLIVAYSAEGWRGSSAEKVKPSKEIERAQAEIMRQKLKIKDMIKHIDETLSYGKLEESLFDSDGQIGSEDIFCAKCGSKDLTLENDIILCDGVCDRGFHQLCLEPPLLNEHIPSDEDGWLCPGCDCKVDCMDLLSEWQETKLSIHSTWENVFPEVSSSSNGVTKMMSFSGESIDDDYDPNGKEKSQEDESSSDESVCTSDPKTLIQKTSEILSDGEEDDDYDPDNMEENNDVAKDENTGSDFSSDSEDLDAICRDNDAIVGDENIQCHMNIELPLSEDTATPVDGNRTITRLDYKKLYDETYGNDSDDSSNDEDYVDIKCRRSKTKAESTPLEPIKETKRRKGTKEVFRNKSNLHKSTALKKQLEGKAKQEKVEYTALETNQIEGKVGKQNTGKISKSDASNSRSLKRHSGEVKERLLELFEENRYPDRMMKENISRELGLSTQQVNKWFDNARCLSKRKSSGTLKQCRSTINN